MTEAQHKAILSVFELTSAIKSAVEEIAPGCWVEGEVGRVLRPASGHVYFSLKDEKRDATLDCVMYKRQAFRFSKNLKEGARVQLRGRASFYPPRGRLQWVADVAREAGDGALLEALQRLRQQLIDEGLTDPERKKALPSAVACLGVVTSRSGAVFSDVVSVARRRGKVRIVLSPAQVQGDGAAESILAALSLIEKLSPDVVIVGRGGGSAEDLMAFNDERVVRAVANFPFPVVSAVGHQTDLCLMDLVADARAATPSEAAELCVADGRAQRIALRRATSQLAHVHRGRLARSSLRLHQLERKMRDPRFLIADEQQGLDASRTRLRQALRNALLVREKTLERSLGRLQARHPRAVLQGARSQLVPLRQRLSFCARNLLAQRRAVVGQAARSLSDLSPLAILGRGYALATTSAGAVVRRAEQLSPGQNLTVRVQSGTFEALVQKIHSVVENAAPIEHDPDLRENDGKDS